MADHTEETLDDLDETALWLKLNHAKVRLALATEVLERIALRNEIGDLSQRIRKAQREGNHASRRGYPNGGFDDLRG